MLISISIYAITLCIEDQYAPYGYEMLFMLPLSFLCSIFLFFFGMLKNKNILENIPCVLLVLLAFIRNVFTPIVMVKDSYVSSLGIANSDGASLAIWLVTYETFLMFLFFYIAEKYRFKQKGLGVLIGLKLPIGKPNNTCFRNGVILFSAIAVIALLFVPSLRNSFYTIFTSGFAAPFQDNNLNRGDILTRAFETGGNMAIAAVRYILPCILFYKLANKGQKLRNLIVSIIVVLGQCFFMTDSNAYILMLIFSQMFFLLELYPKYRKGMIGGIAIVLISFSLMMYFNRFALDHYSKSLSLWLQSYFPGVANTAGIVNILPQQNILQIFEDIWVAIPFKAFLGYSGDATSIAQKWIIVNNCKGQILSTIGQSFYYFGFIFSPLISCWLLQISRKCQQHVNCVDSALMRAAYIYFMIYSAATPFVYNFSIYAHAFLQRTIFIFALAYFSPYSMSALEKNRQ